ncbi:MAG: HAD family hydrolase [Actinomycetota bacterium]
MIKIVFLDAGETLLYPHPSFVELFSNVCKERGYDISPERVQEVRRELAPHLVDLAEDTGVENPSFSPEESRTFWTHLYQRFLARLGIEDEALVGALYGRFSHVSSYRLFEDALPALTQLHRRGYRLGLISNFEEWLEEMLVELEVGHLFDVTVISGIERVEKPDVKIYEVALERAGVAPDEAVHVGDSPGLDVEPARGAGMHAVLLDRLDHYAHLDDVVTVRSLADLPDVVSGL